MTSRHAPSDPIKVGDLVYVAKRPICCFGKLGKVFRVTELSGRDVHGPWHCSSCGATGVSEHRNVVFAAGCSDGRLIPVNQLKRIPPLDELETTKHDEEITA